MRFIALLIFLMTVSFPVTVTLYAQQMTEAQRQQKLEELRQQALQIQAQLQEQRRSQEASERQQQEQQRAEQDAQRQASYDLQQRNMEANRQAQQRDIENARQFQADQVRQAQQRTDQEAAERDRQAQLSQQQREAERDAQRKASNELQQRNMEATRQAQQRDIDNARQFQADQVRQEQQRTNAIEAERARQANLTQQQWEIERQNQQRESDERRKASDEQQRRNMEANRQAQQRDIDNARQFQADQVRQAQQRSDQEVTDARARSQSEREAYRQQQLNEIQRQALILQEQVNERARQDAQSRARDVNQQEQQKRNQLEAEREQRNRTQALSEADRKYELDKIRQQALQLQSQLRERQQQEQRNGNLQTRSQATPPSWVMPSDSPQQPRNQATSIPPTRSFGGTSTQAPPVGLSENDRRWVQSLPNQLQSQILKLSPAQIDATKARGNWGRIQQAFTESATGIRNADVEGQREQIAIWEKAWSNTKTIVEIGSMAIPAEGLLVAAKEVVSLSRKYRALEGARIATTARNAKEIKAIQLEANKAKGKLGEDLIAEKYKSQITGKQVTIYTNDGTRTRVDFVTRDKGIIEVKTGNSKLSPGQKKLHDDVTAGRSVRFGGPTAINSGNKTDVPTRMKWCTIERPC
jgi:hypothetical protein